MILYLLRSSGCLLLLWIAYKGLLEKEKMARFNRFYLLASLLSSFLVPLIRIASLSKTTVRGEQMPAWTAPIQKVLATAPASTAVNAVQESHGLSIGLVLLNLYGIVTIGLLVRFVRSLYLIRRRITENEQLPLEEATLVLLPDETRSHTFYKTIFVGEQLYKDEELQPEVLSHELAHVRQRHTLDILLIETLQVFLWFNPLLLFYKRAIQLNHEFLADQAVVDTYKNPKQYQYLLLNAISPGNPLSLSSPLNYQITKKRLIMITATTHPKIALAKKIALLPLLFSALFLFSTTTSAQQDKKTTHLHEDYTILSADDLGPQPLVIIDDKEYPSDILTKISPSCTKMVSVFGIGSSVQQFGAKAKDGCVKIETNADGLTYATNIEKQNLVKERAARTGFYHRLTLKHNDGTEYDKLIINMPNGSSNMSQSGYLNSEVAFLVKGKVYNESQIGEVEKLVKEMDLHSEIGIGQAADYKIPGVDLSYYQVLFYFGPAPDKK